MALIAEWGFDEGTGTTTADLTGNGYTLTLGGGASWNVGHTNGGISGPGSGNSPNSSAAHRAGFPGGVPSGALTVMCWSRPANFGPLISAYNTSGNQSPFGILFDTGGVLVGAVTDEAGTAHASEARSAAGLITTGTWYHVAYVLNPSTSMTTLYLNGLQVASGAWNNTVPSIWSNLLVGSSRWGALGGPIDDVRIFNTALTPSEITAWMITPAGSGGGSEEPVLELPILAQIGDNPVSKIYIGNQLVVRISGDTGEDTGGDDGGGSEPNTGDWTNVGSIGARPMVTEKPDETTTGPAYSTLLTMTGPEAINALFARPIEADGFKVLRRVHVTSAVTMEWQENEKLRFEDCIIEDYSDTAYGTLRMWWAGSNSTEHWVEFVRCDISGGLNSAVLGGYVRLLRCNIHHGFDNVQIHRPIEMYACYLHDLAYTNGGHCDAIQVLGGGGSSLNALIHYNNVIAINANDSDAPGTMANRALQTGALLSNAATFYFTNNWFNGGGYTVDATEGDGTYTLQYIFRNNKFGPDSTWGPLYNRAVALSQADFDNSNIWENTGLPV